MLLGMRLPDIAADRRRGYGVDDRVDKPVGFWFGLMIFLIPMPVALLTLQKGYSALARVLALGWLVAAALLTASAIDFR